MEPLKTGKPVVLVLISAEFNNYIRRINGYFFDFLSAYDDIDFIFLHIADYNNGVKAIRKYIDFPFSKWVTNTGMKRLQSVSALWPKLESIYHCYKPTSVIVFNSVLNFNVREFQKYYENKEVPITFDSTRRRTLLTAIPYFFFEKGIPVFQFKNDPQEFSFPFAIQFFFSEYKGAQYFPNYEFSMFMKQRHDYTMPYRNLDMVFGYTILTKDRIPLRDIYFRLEKMFTRTSLKYKLYLKDTQARPHILKHTHYLHYTKLLGSSRFTLIIPPYDINSFSWVRFFEALNNGCAPLIWHSCNLGSVNKELIRVFVNKGLIIENERQLIKRITVDDDRVIFDTLMNTSFMKARRSKDFYVSFFKRFRNRLLSRSR